MIENVEEPSQFTHAHEEGLPKFKIDLLQLKQKNLSKKPKIHDFALEESTGIGIMLSKREADVEKLPRSHALRNQRAKSPLVQISRKGLPG